MLGLMSVTAGVLPLVITCCDTVNLPVADGIPALVIISVWMAGTVVNHLVVHVLPPFPAALLKVLVLE